MVFGKVGRPSSYNFTQRQMDLYLAGVIAQRRDAEIMRELGMGRNEFQALKRQALATTAKQRRSIAEHRASQVDRLQRVEQLAFEAFDKSRHGITKRVQTEKGERVETIQTPPDAKALGEVTRSIGLQAELLGTKAVVDHRVIVEHVGQAKRALAEAACDVLKDYPELMERLAEKISQLNLEAER